VNAARDVIHVACSADQRFLPDCGVMLHSLFAANPGERFAVHFLHDRLMPAAELESLRGLVAAGGGEFVPHVVAPELTAQFPFTERFGYSAWYRVLLPDTLAALPRVLYLDSDLLINAPLRPLWQTDVSNHALAAVTQPVPEGGAQRVVETLGLPGREHYFNAGVMLLNLDELRRLQASRQVLQFIREGRGPMPWADQDPMNAVLHARRLPLHARWNVMTPMFETPDALPPFPPAELREATHAPAVVHFIGEYKPLHYRCRHPYRKAYFGHLRHTPWRDRPIHGRSLRNLLLRWLPWSWQFAVERVLRQAGGRLRKLLHRGQ